MSNELIQVIPARVTESIDTLKQHPLTYNGDRVLTLAAVDRVPGRAEKSTINHWEQYRLGEGKHYHEVPYPVWSQWVTEATNSVASYLPAVPSGGGGFRGNLKVVTMRGYLRLVMKFEDALADDICEYLIDCYFEKEESPLITVAGFNESITRLFDIEKEISRGVALSMQQNHKDMNALSTQVSAVDQKLVQLVETGIPEIVEQAVSKVQDQLLRRPNTVYRGEVLPTELPDPANIPPSGQRAYVNNAVRTLYRWWNKPVDPITYPTIYNTFYNLYGWATGFHVSHNFNIYLARTGDTVKLNMLDNLGRLSGLARLIFETFGRQQPFVQAKDYDGPARTDLTPVAEKAGNVYFWQTQDAPTVGRKRRGNRQQRADEAAASTLTPEARRALDQRGAEQDRVRYASESLQDTVADAVDTFDNLRTPPVNSEPFLQAQTRCRGRWTPRRH